MAKSTKTVKRRDPPPSVRDEVLREAGYKCANPTCRNILTLQLHHIVWVKDDGGTNGINLIALCGHCHDLHTQGHIPASAIRHWKGMLHALNYAFSKESMDLLLFLGKCDTKGIWYSGDGVLKFAPLLASGLAQLSGGVFVNIASVPGPGPISSHHVILTDKGTALVDAWLKGDEERYKIILQQSIGK